MMHTSFEDSDALGKFSPPTYANWLGELRKLFPIPDEFLLADAIYPFAEDWERELSPQQSYDRFDAWAAES